MVNIHGDVSCKEKCGPFVSVTLVRQADKHNEERKTISLTTKSSEFLFSNVIPGKYRLEVGLFCFCIPILSSFLSRISLVLSFIACKFLLNFPLLLVQYQFFSGKF